MNKLLLTLSSLLVAFVTAFPAQAQEIKGDASKGATKIALCIGCHGIVGYQASFPEVYKVPMISGQGAKFIVSALNAYKKGERKHPTMRAVAESLSDQDMADVAAYYEGSGKVEGAALPAKAAEPSGKVAALLNKGGCIACHGGNFSTPTTCLWRSNPTRPKATRLGAAATPSWAASPSSSPMTN